MTESDLEFVFCPFEDLASVIEKLITRIVSDNITLYSVNQNYLTVLS